MRYFYAHMLFLLAEPFRENLVILAVLMQLLEGCIRMFDT